MPRFFPKLAAAIALLIPIAEKLRRRNSQLYEESGTDRRQTSFSSGISLAELYCSLTDPFNTERRIFMARARRAGSIKRLVSQSAEDDIWGMPESPEFSSVQHLISEFQSHANYEERWLSSYKEILTESQDPLVRYLLGLIVADEERHHQLMDRMISKLKDELAWTRAERALRRRSESGEKSKRLLVSLESFLDVERKGIKEYERLKKTSQGLYRDVFALLYSTMINDSSKHIAILDFLRRRLKQSQGLPRHVQQER
jgi:rubrerythrin